MGKQEAVINQSLKENSESMEEGLVSFCILSLEFLSFSENIAGVTQPMYFISPKLTGSFAVKS